MPNQTVLGPSDPAKANRGRHEKFSMTDGKLEAHKLTSIYQSLTEYLFINGS
jgi:hypothetical protein